MSDRVSPPQSIEVSVTVLTQMFRYLADRKVDKDALLRSVGVDPASIASPDAYLPIETYLRIQDGAAEYTGDPCFGLHTGEFVEPGSWSILGYMMMNCKTLGEAFEKSARYSRVIGNLIEGRAVIRLNRVKLVFFTPPQAPTMSRHCFEATFASTVRMMRTLTGVKLSPLEVTFIYPKPASISEYERILCCPVRFAQRENSMTVAASIGRTPILAANPGLLEYFERYAQEFLLEMDRKSESARRVTRIILSRLDDEALSIAKVAREMAVSVRTLQKRLESEGVAFSDLLRATRERLAKKYLHENYSVEEITYLLGFSEPSVFRKAFKKWSGVTPGEYRKADPAGLPRREYAS
ncbi:MAG TPA: AraC family transcriptional regulator [Spirochaetia bacterium]|nr:AraC family transcriptional regulator [Spirochaetia bacterium]